MRFLIPAIVLAVAFTIYSLVDITVTDDRRIKTLNRILWVVIIAVLPIVGPLAWLLLGKAPRSAYRPTSPDDDVEFTGGRSGSSDISKSEADRRISELEAQLEALDDEDAPAAEPGDDVAAPADDAADATADDGDIVDDPAAKHHPDDQDPSARA